MSLVDLRPEEETNKDSDQSLNASADILAELKLMNKYLERIVGADLRDEIELGG